MSVELFCEGMAHTVLGFYRRVQALVDIQFTYGNIVVPQETNISLHEQNKLIGATNQVFQNFIGPDPKPGLPILLTSPKGEPICRVDNIKFFITHIHQYLKEKDQQEFRRVERLGALLLSLMYEVYYNIQFPMELDFNVEPRVAELYRRRALGPVPFSLQAAKYEISEVDFNFLKGIARSSYKIPIQGDDNWSH